MSKLELIIQLAKIFIAIIGLIMLAMLINKL